MFVHHDDSWSPPWGSTCAGWVHIQTGFVTAYSEHVVSFLVQRLGSLDFISDNAGSFANGAFPRSGSFILFGVHLVYVGTTPARKFPEVMMAGADATGKGVAGTKDILTMSGCPAKPALERQQNNVGTFAAPRHRLFSKPPWTSWQLRSSLMLM
ncbi:hypothetical protein QYE76_059433 [Lolium multiflorum]|uniref:Uncharacterized protein n=1 Tax=Lolium multiflorum TaxID=4521 RepID=A0AAD8W3B6_LOLMU|nr:hypothetical protein QYE76_059433 [Lolium multiflorum]